MSGYTSSPRRGSSEEGGEGPAAASTHAYVPGENAHETAGAGHHHSSQHQISTSYVSDASSSGSVAHRHGQSVASGGGSSSHAAHSDGRHFAVASRH
jgi:hypothetical protein